MTYQDTQLFINGSWCNARDGRSQEVTNPFNGEKIGRVAHAGVGDLDDAVKAADLGFRIWRDTPAVHRGAIIGRASDILRDRVETIAELMTLEQGKPLRESRAEVLGAADILTWFGEEASRVYGRLIPSRTGQTVRQMAIKDPVGPVAAFTPWNFPVNQIVRKIGPALATGCSVVLKAPEETPASPAALVAAFEEAGLPAGVLNLIYGNPPEISQYLISHPVIRKVSFTGSTAVGRHLAQQAGHYLKRVSLELGGHAPVIICENADVPLAVRTIGAAKFRNAGQVCIAPTRFLVHSKVYDQFAEGLSELARSLTVGDGLDSATQMGPLANPRRVTAVEAVVKDALARNATILAGGHRIGDGGGLFQPTVIADLPEESVFYTDEPFGPVAGLRRFDLLDEAIQEANRLPYGLAGYAFTRSLSDAESLMRGVEVGMLWINMAAAPSAELPFGGLKDSGYGTEGGAEALEAYLNTRSVAISTS